MTELNEIVQVVEKSFETKLERQGLRTMECFNILEEKQVSLNKLTATLKADLEKAGELHTHSLSLFEKAHAEAAALAQAQVSLQTQLATIQTALHSLTQADVQCLESLHTLEASTSQDKAELLKRIEVEHVLVQDLKGYVTFLAKTEAQKATAEALDSTQFDRYEIQVDEHPAIDAKLFALESRLRAAEAEPPRCASANSKGKRTLRVFEKVRKVDRGNLLLIDSKLEQRQEANTLKSTPKIISKIVSKPSFRMRPSTPGASSSTTGLLCRSMKLNP